MLVIFYTVKQMSMRYPAWTESALRNLIFNAKENGLDKAIKRVGKKVLIEECRWLEWLKSQDEASKKP